MYFDNEISENAIKEEEDFQLDIDPDRNFIIKVNRNRNLLHSGKTKQ